MEIKIRTPLQASMPDSPKQFSDVKRALFGTGGMNVIRSLARSVSGNGSREDSTEETSNRKKTIAARTKELSDRQKVPSQSQYVSEGEESEEDVKGAEEQAKFGSSTDAVVAKQKSASMARSIEMQDDSIPKGRRFDGVHGWGMGKNVLEASKVVAADIRGSLFQMKEMLVDKLAAVPIPAESLESARQSIESILREATQTAYGMTKDAMQRIRLRLVEIIPSLSASETREIVDDVEREMLDMSEASQEKHSNSGVSPSTVSAVSSKQPSSPSILSLNVNRIKSWALLRSRL